MMQVQLNSLSDFMKCSVSLLWNAQQSVYFSCKEDVRFCMHVCELTVCCASGGSDLNRMWRSPSKDLEPSIHHSLKMMLEIDADPRFSLDVFVDVHSHSASRAGFLFMNPLPSSHSSCAPLAEYLYRLPKAMAGSVPGFQLSKCCSSTEAFKAACGRRTAGLHLPNTLCYTFEISFFNVVDEPNGGNQRNPKARNSNSSSAQVHFSLWASFSIRLIFSRSPINAGRSWKFEIFLDESLGLKNRSTHVTWEHVVVSMMTTNSLGTAWTNTRATLSCLNRSHNVHAGCGSCKYGRFGQCKLYCNVPRDGQAAGLVILAFLWEDKCIWQQVDSRDVKKAEYLSRTQASLLLCLDACGPSENLNRS